MLNPPLSLLSDDLLCYVVDNVAKLPSSHINLYNLSITDRAFTRFCQAHIFKDLYLGYGYFNDIISRKLVKIKNILNDKPSFANRVRTVHINTMGKQNVWLLNDHTFIDIIQLLAKSLMPPHKLHLSGFAYSKIEDHVHVVGILTQSFFSRTLTVLDLTYCENVPLTLFLVCPNLREVCLGDVAVSESGYDEYPDSQCFGRELPALERLKYRNSETLIEKMITPPPKFSMAVVDWSKLRVLELYPQEKEGMMCLQPILDAACNTLEELHLTYGPNLRATLGWNFAGQLSLAGLVNLRHLPNFHIFTFHAFIKCDAHEPVVSRDINSILATIPDTNQVRQLTFRFNIYGEHPFGGCLEQDWVGMCDEVVRVSAGKTIALYLELSIVPTFCPHPGGDELYERIKEKIAYLSDYPNICTHLCHI